MRIAAVILCLPVCLLATLRAAEDDDEPAQRGKFQTLNVNQLERRYILRAPGDLKPGELLPVVFVFHGGSGNAAGMERLSKFTPLAETERFIVVYPEGVEKNWNDGRTLEKSRAHRENLDDVGFINALLDKLLKENSADPRRIYACGISNGAIFSHRLGMELSARIAAIAGVCGSLAEALEDKFAPANPVSVLIINGDDDPMAPYNGGEITFKRGRISSTDDTIKKWVQANGCDASGTKGEPLDKVRRDGTRVLTTTWSGGRAKTEVVLMKVEGGGHTWPGGNQYLPELVIGKTSREFDATATLWEFFKRHAKAK